MKISNILIGSENPKALAEFYEKVFKSKPGWEESGYTGFDCGGTFFTIGPHDKVHGPNPSPERIILGFEAQDVKGEFERIKGLGAKVIAEPYHPAPAEDMMIATLADPDGNYFQVASPWKGGK